MKKYLSIKIAINGLLALFSISILFHLLVLIGIIPYNMVWGGKLTSFQDMIAFESISIIANSLMLIICLVKINKIKLPISIRNMKIIFWAIGLLFLLNTFGNIFSESTLETVIFTPLTAIASIFAIRIAID